MGSDSRTEGLLSSRNPPKAVFSLNKLNIRVPVFDGTVDLVLKRCVGWIAGTARPGEPTSA
jgi:hypothetical protein